MSRKPLAARTAAPVGRDDVLAELRRVVDEAVPSPAAGTRCSYSPPSR